MKVSAGLVPSGGSEGESARASAGSSRPPAALCARQFMAALPPPLFLSLPGLSSLCPCLRAPSAFLLKGYLLLDLGPDLNPR